MSSVPMLEHHHDFIRTCQLKRYQNISFSYSLGLNVHGIPIRIHARSKELFNELSHWPLIEPEAAAAESELQLYWVAPEYFLEKAVPQWGEWVEHHCFQKGDFIFQRDFCAKRISKSETLLMANEKVGDGFYNYLRFLLPPLLLKKNRVLFHSSCVVDEKNEAYLFFGYSGAGKTTMAGLCQEGMILGDDMCLLECEGSDLWVEAARVGQVFQNQKSLGRRFLVKGVFWLKKGQSVEIEPLKGGVTPKLLSSFSGLYWEQMSQEDLSHAMNLCQNIGNANQIYQLEFPKNEGVWSELRRKLVQQNFSEETRPSLANP